MTCDYSFPPLVLVNKTYPTDITTILNFKKPTKPNLT